MIQENRLDNQIHTCIHSFKKYLSNGCYSMQWGYDNKRKPKHNIKFLFLGIFSLIDGARQ